MSQDHHHYGVVDDRQSPPNPLTLAFDLFGDIEAALDKQIFPQWEMGGYDTPPDDRKYSVTLTAGDWRRYGEAMRALERAVKSEGGEGQ